MRQTFEKQVAAARQAHRRSKLASYNRAYRASLVKKGAPDPRHVRARLFSLLTLSDGWDALAQHLVLMLADDGYDPVASQAVIDRMLNVDTSSQS